jgi:hypothetical protein
MFISYHIIILFYILLCHYNILGIKRALNKLKESCVINTFYECKMTNSIFLGLAQEIIMLDMHEDFSFLLGSIPFED